MRHVIRLAAAALLLGCGGGSNQTGGDGGSSSCMAPTVEYQPEPRTEQGEGWGPVCVYQPKSGGEVVRTQCGEVTERCDTSGTLAPALDCIANPVANEPTTPDRVTLTGFAMVFSGGPDSKGISIKVYDADSVKEVADLDGAAPIGTYTTALPPSGTPPDGDVRACPSEDESKNNHIGCVSPQSAACDPPCQDSVTGMEFCYVAPGQTTGRCVERTRYEPRYTIPNVPTRKRLLIVSTGPGGKDDPLWNMLVQENEYISTAGIECDGTVITNCFHDKDGASPSYELNVNALSRGDYSSISAVAGLPAGIPKGHGGIAGEVRDCGDIRLEHAQVGTVPAATILTYFNGNQWDSLPILARGDEGTCRLGLYAALDLPPGKVQIEAVGLVGGALTPLGWYAALVFPDAVTVVSLNTGRPLPVTP